MITLTEIPDKYKWKAQDADGKWFAYEHEPIAGSRFWATKDFSAVLRMGQGKPNPNWKKTCQPIYEYYDASR